jgi:hypothetical protein
MMPIRINDSVNGVYNDGACIKIVFNGSVVQVTKAQIKTIDTIRNDTVRLDIGEGALKNIYVRLSDVSYPEGFSDVVALRNYIKDLMIQNGFSTEAKQDAEISELQLIRQALLDIKVVFQNGGGGGTGGGVKQPLREDESQPNVIYKGYAAPNANTTDAVWAIIKISRIKSEIIYEWADGDENYDNIWENRYEIRYFPSGFIIGPAER